MKKIIFMILIVAALSAFMCINTFCEEAVLVDATAESKDFRSTDAMLDGKRTSYAVADGQSLLTLTKTGDAVHLYIEFDLVPDSWTLTDPATGKSFVAGKNGFLHEYINIPQVLGDRADSFELRFPSGTSIADIYLYSEGELPSHLQTWSEPLEEVDIMLISSHSDDEQLFFAGVLPYYAIERQLKVQVVYIVQHFSVGDERNHIRSHEQLDGLWTVGIRSYPVMTDFPDVYSESTDRETAFKQAEKAFGNYGVTYEDFCSYLTECIRRFKPLVVVSHDLDGEYGHGTHVLCASALTEAIGFAADSEKYPDSYEKYGSWQVEKTYLHLYEENKITMDWDIPYDSMGGKTPFQMTQEGFGCHKSQHWCWFNDWIYGKNNNITKATQITYCSPCEYGLYDSRVGADVVGGDFMENVIPRSQRKTEVEKLPGANENMSPAESEELPDSTLARITLDSPVPRQRDNAVIIIAVSVLVIALSSVIIIICTQNKRKRRRRRRR